eukprot:scpid7802/ scgid31048/ Inositol phosphorylceramide synthase catalytic subunit aur1; Aureobasidin A resistance protein homolog; Phosphatidylinositol:ceramide phosphoinositol transferase
MLQWKTTRGEKKAEGSEMFRFYKEAFSCLPIKLVFYAAIPFVLYILFFRYYAFFREFTGIASVSRPNINVLPWLEEMVFQCLPHRILAKFAHPLLDFIAAIPYLVHFPLPVLFGLYLLSDKRRRPLIFRFFWCAGWVNLSALCIQFIFPTAPPWFADSAVFDDDDGKLISVSPNEGGFQRLDARLGISVFHSIYSKSPVTFGAMPSLHVAWPMIILMSRPWVNKKFAAFHVCWITWAALYSNHHYGVDAMAGIMLVVLVFFMEKRVWSPFRSEVDEYAPRHTVYRTPTRSLSESSAGRYHQHRRTYSQSILAV